MAHNYQKKINRMLKRGVFEPGGMSDIQILHDSWCGVNRGSECNCDPDIIVRPLPNLQAVALSV
jgi:hypothetical protein